MKKATFVVVAGLLGLTTLAGCFEIQEPAPHLDAESIKVAVQGRWSVERVNNKFCRDNSCSTTTVTGKSEEYFEFKTDSAFLVRVSPVMNAAFREAYKANYNNDGVILLKNDSRTEQFEVLELREKRMVLQSSFAGRDPAAVFTDTYYLKK